MSTLQVNTLQDLTGNERFTANAWVNFDGTGTVAIRKARNVASITDNGVGDYTVNFTAPMPHATYAVAGTARDDDAVPTTVIGMAQASAKTTGTCGIVVTEVTLTIVDSADVNVIVFA